MLKELLSTSTVLVGVGNALRGDDSFGPLVIRKILTGGYPLNAIDAGTAPENYVSRIARLKPSLVVMIDAVHFGAEPGRTRVFRSSELGGASLTTHGMPLSAVMEEIQTRTGVPTLLLGVQPGRLTIGEPLSGPLQAALEDTLDTIAEWARMHLLARPKG